MRTSLIINKHIKTILVTSSDMDEGKTTVTSSLAKCFSELEDKKVLLIDCDLRKPSIHRQFKLDNEKGLIDVIIEGNFKEYIKNKDTRPKFTFKEQKEFETIYDDIEKLEIAISSIEEEMSKNASNYGLLSELDKEKNTLEEELMFKYERQEYLENLDLKIKEFNSQK